MVTERKIYGKIGKMFLIDKLLLLQNTFKKTLPLSEYYKALKDMLSGPIKTILKSSSF